MERTLAAPAFYTNKAHTTHIVSSFKKMASNALKGLAVTLGFVLFYTALYAFHIWVFLP